jgi:hypothetical protein
MLDRKSLHEVGGFNEVYRVARIGIDYNFLVKVVSAGLETRDIGGPVYHLNHLGSYRLARETYRGREAEAPYGNVRWHSRGTTYTNPPHWGLARAPERRDAAHKSTLVFSWDAVPPMVDLRRVVLPVARAGGPFPGSFAE